MPRCRYGRRPSAKAGSGRTARALAFDAFTFAVLTCTTATADALFTVTPFAALPDGPLVDPALAETAVAPVGVPSVPALRPAADARPLTYAFTIWNINRVNGSMFGSDDEDGIVKP